MTEFKKHLSFKVFTNLLKIPINLILNAIFPRLLGPVAYGNFDFLQDSASKIIGFFDTGSSIAFYTRLSKNYTDRKLIKFYWIIVAALSCIYIVFVISTKLFGFTESVWPKQDFLMIVLSTILGIITFLSNTFILITDAANLTVNVEKVRMIHMITSVIIYAGIFGMFRIIDLSTFFLLQILLICLLISGCYFVLHATQINIFHKESLNTNDLKEYASYFWIFSNPLIVYSIVGLITGIGGRWILQQFGGSIQQAYFGLSAKIGGFVLLFSSALMPLIMREFSKLFAQEYKTELIRLYTMSYKGLYIIAMFIAIFIFFNAEIITRLLGGAKFQQATYILSIMAFYPVHQSIAQVNGSFFYSTGRNKAHRNIGLVSMICGLLLSFFLIAPTDYFGLGLGAEGLAIQLLFIQILGSNVSSYVNSKFLQIDYLALLFYQLMIFILFYASGFMCNFLSDKLSESEIYQLLIFAISFSLITLSLAYIFPAIAGFKNRSEIRELVTLRKI
jgi:O-antigen/teichoic acid export membrane protein